MLGTVIPPVARASPRIQVKSNVIVFVHSHRLGPPGADDPVQWHGPGGRPRIVNTGSWLNEPLLVHRATGPHPYWPGGAVRLGDDGSEPRAVGLLDGLSVEVLH